MKMQEEAIDMVVSTLRKLSQDEKERIKYEDRHPWLEQPSRLECQFLI